MFKHAFINLIYVSKNCRKLYMLLEIIKEGVINLKRLNKAKEIIFVKFLTACPKYCNNKWYLA